MKIVLLLSNNNNNNNNNCEIQSLYSEVKCFNLFFVNELNIIFEITKIIFEDLDVNNYILSQYDNGFIYYALSEKSLLKEKYMESLFFANKCKEILLQDGNYKRIIDLNLNLFSCYVQYKNYNDCYELSKAQLFLLKSFKIEDDTKTKTLKYYLLSSLALEKYDEIISLVGKKQSILITELCEYLVALYKTNNDKYLQTLNETLNNSQNNDSIIKICETINEYLQNNNKKVLNNLNGLVLEVLIEILKDK